MSNATLESGDSDDLEALFDSIVKANNGGPATTTADAAPAAPPPAVPVTSAPMDDMAAFGNLEDFPEPANSMFSKIGHLTRKLHDTLRELGYDKSLEEAASVIPDARERLAYISTLMEQAAERALTAVDAAMPLQDKLQSNTEELAARWQALFDKKLSVDEFKTLVTDTRGYFGTVQNHSKETSAQLLEIMMAQDFQDLTGQVIKKIITMAKDMEGHLLSFLVEFSSPNKRADTGLMNGPVISAEGRTDVVTSQEQVDDLLESLGF